MRLYEIREGTCAETTCQPGSEDFFRCLAWNCSSELSATTDLLGAASLEYSFDESALVIDLERLMPTGFLIHDMVCETELLRSVVIPAAGNHGLGSASRGVPGCMAQGVVVPTALSIPEPTPPAPQPEVRVLYFVPGDLIPDSAQEARILQASQDVHRWYSDHTDWGRSLAWSGGVERVIGDNTLTFYSLDFWSRVLTELSSRGYPLWQTQKVFAIWVKGAGLWAGGAQASGNYGGAALLGGEIFIEDGCSPTHPSLWPCTPGGAMAHELGHALGLPHPDAAGSWFGVDLNSHSLMGSHWNFPERYTRPWVPDSPWGLLNYERDVERYNPLVSVTGSPYPALPGDPMQKPDLPNPPVSLDVGFLSATQCQVFWNLDGANQYSAYWSTAKDFSTYSPLAGSPTSGSSLSHTDSGQSPLYFKVFEIPIRQ